MVSEGGDDDRRNEDEARKGLGDPKPGSIRELILKSAPSAPPTFEDDEEDEPPSMGKRVLAIGILIAAAVLIYSLVKTERPYSVDAEFANASQLVAGNEVLVGGARAGVVDRIELGDDNQAIVTLSISEDYAPLHRGTVATVRSPSLSQVAGRQVQLTLPVDSAAGEEIPDGGVMSQSETISEVDLDQIFNTLDPETVKDFKHVIQGLEISYEGVGKQANRGLRYLNPFLSTSRRVFAELSSDQVALENLIVDTSRLSGALAARSPDVTQLIGNLNSMMNAIGDRKTELARAISLFPDFMREANTTFVNLRAALDDLDPLVSASKPVAERLRPFLAELRVAAADAVPTIKDLDVILAHPGKANDLVELMKVQPPLADAALGSGSPECGPGPRNPEDLEVAADDDYTQGAFGETVCSLDNSLSTLEFFRAYTPELVGWFNGFSEFSGTKDALGGIGRLMPVFNTFTISLPGGLPDILGAPDGPLEQLGLLHRDEDRRCPGANERPLQDLGDDSVPFTDGGALTDGVPGDCDPEDGLPGP